MASDPQSDAPGAAFLLVQLGFFGARRFAAKLAPIGLEPRQFGLLRAIAATPGQSQQELAATLGIHPSKVVGLVDDLEAHGLVARRRSSDDRRTNALALTAAGRGALTRARRAAREHADELLAALDADEREQLTRLLRRVAAAHDLAAAGLPGPPFRRE